MAAAITDARGRILLARRTAGRDLAGLWEFPGGKREPGETPEHALVRELREELGIEVKIGAPLIAVAQQYPHKRLCLDVRRVTRWRGTPRGHEGQRSEEHTSELQSLMRISYAVFCLKKKKTTTQNI